jgi:glycosidase
LKRWIGFGIGLAVVTLMMGCASTPKSPPMSAFNLGGHWLFARDAEDVGVEEGWFAPELDEQEWQPIAVPADWGAYEGVGWYRRRMALPPSLHEERMRLVFDRIEDESRVYVNGRVVVESRTWNRRLVADVTESAGSTVSVAVRVVGRGESAGITGPVRLVTALPGAEPLAGPWHEEPALAPPEWLPGSVIYEVFPRNFSVSGDLNGVRERVPELRALGVDVIWLMPIHPTGEVKRKGSVGSPYAIQDHRAIHPDLGTEEDLRRLVETVHANGMRIILDAVLNHAAPDNPLTEEHPDWFEQDAEGNPISDNAEWTDTVAFDWESRKVWKYFDEVMTHWVREFDIDGYRCDVASYVPTAYWEHLLLKLRRIKPDVVMLAESDAPELHRAAFHVSYNWTLHDALAAVLARERLASHLADAMAMDLGTFQAGALRMAFAENHDTERAATAFGGARQAKVAALITLTVAPCPLIYNGQEVGYDAPREIFERTPIAWTDAGHLREFIQAVIALRRESRALRLGDFRALSVNRPAAVFAFERRTEGERAVVVVNCTDEALDVRGPELSEALADAPPGSGPLSVGIWRPDPGLVSLPPFGGEVWVISND